MEKNKLDELIACRKKECIRLSEVQDLTKQLLEAVDRRDQISIQMLLTMREDPIRQLTEMEEGLKRRLLELPEEDAIRARELLEGAEAEDGSEMLLMEQVDRFAAILRSTLEMDRNLSVKLGGRRSFYTNFR